MKRFEGTDTYIATDDLMMAVNAALTLERPLLDWVSISLPKTNPLKGGEPILVSLGEIADGKGWNHCFRL